MSTNAQVERKRKEAGERRKEKKREGRSNRKKKPGDVSGEDVHLECSA